MYSESDKITTMKRPLFSLALMCAFAIPGMAASLGTNSRAVIPSGVQQIISADYRAMRNSETAMALKNRVLPDNLKQFETSIKSLGISTERDMEQLTFAAYRPAGGKGIRSIGIASGTFPTKQILAKMKVKKIKGDKYRDSVIYPSGSGLMFTFLDPNTMLFGDMAAVKDGIDARDGEIQNLNGNSQMSEMVSAVESGPVWSVLDQLGTQNMMRSALGDAAGLADYDTIKKRLLGSRYIVDFSRGVNFDLDVMTSDTMTAATLSSLIKAGMMYKKMNSTPVEKAALDSMSVDSDSGKLTMHFKSDDRKFQSLLSSDLFAAVSK
jgi:hypothetical protein